MHFCNFPMPDLENSAGKNHLPKKSWSAAKIIVSLSIAAVLVPAAACAIGIILIEIIPGCHCDEGAGCRGCGANGLVASLLFGGFVGAIVAAIFLPAGIVIALIVRFFTPKIEGNKPEPSPDQRCPFCHKITPVAYSDCIWCHKTIVIESKSENAA